MDKNAIIKALRDYAQATSNEVANTVAAPIDIINAGLGYVGLGSNEPVGGSAWMRRQGLTAPVPEGMAQTLGETTGLVLPMAGAMKAKEIATALRGMGENIAKPKGGGMAGGQKGAIVWHGSPHKFDKFDASKIGTGEGAQAYGHGLYFAESPEVAREYQKNVTALRMPIDTFADEEVAAAKKLLVVFGQKDGALQVKRMFGSRADEVLAKANDVTGSLYKVDLPDEHIARMLDWDKPLSQQPKNVQQALNSKPMQDAINKLKQTGELANHSRDDMLKYRGEDYYDFMRQAHGESNVVPSEFLHQQGIPGIRYLDGGSRGAGAGTSNFVVFPGNENILNILERNGAPIPPQNLVKALRNGN